MNQDLTAVQKRVTKLSADIKVVQATYADLGVQLADMNPQPVSTTPADPAKEPRLRERSAPPRRRS